MRIALTCAFAAALCAAARLVPARADAGPGVPYCNVQRTGFAPRELKPPYRAAWIHAARQKPRPAWREPAWEPQRIDFDYAYGVSASGDAVYYASSSDHALHALDLASGREKWKFITDGPVRLAAEFHGSNVLFGSDDGFVYCVDGGTGRLAWKFRPDVPDSRLVGNEQMISRRPARSGVLVEGDRAYATFGMLSPEGVAVCCLDARDGRLLWINDTCGYRYMARPHVATMGGVSPQGYMAVGENLLVVTCGRSTPALFDKQTGDCVYHEADGDFTGGAWTMTAPGLVFTPAHTLQKEFGSQLRRDDASPEADVFELATLVALEAGTGREVFSLRGGAQGVLADDGLITLIGRRQLLAVPIDDVRKAIGKKSVIRHTMGHFVEGEEIKKWSAPVDRVYSLLQAGDTIIAGGRGTVECFDAADGRKLWAAPVDGQARAMCLGPDRLIVSTTEGRIYCFAPAEEAGAAMPAPVSPATVPLEAPADARPQDGPRKGYALVLGRTTAERLGRCADDYDLTIYATDGDPTALRERLDAAGLYGTRVVVHHVAGPALPYTDYFANAVLFDAASADEIEPARLAELYRVLRPCGGVAEISCGQAPPAQLPRTLRVSGAVSADVPLSTLRRAAIDAKIPESELSVADGCLRIVRGPLPGAGEWTHQYGDAGKRVSSDERRVRLPLKAVWFGGLGPATQVSRHFREPAPLVIDGRSFIPGTDHLTAMDIYNGRLLWQRELADLAHWPAAYRGPSVAADHEAVYAAQGLRCLRLEPATGRTLGEYRPPQNEAAGTASDQAEWEYLALADELVIGTVGQANIKHEWWSKAYPVNHVVFALEKKAGSPRWLHRPEQEIDSNAIAIDDGRVFLIDGRPRYTFLPDRRGVDPAGLTARKLRALDVATGEVLWETADVVPTLNSLWVDEGVVVATTAPYARSMVDVNVAKAGGGITAYSARDGSKLWRIEQAAALAPFICQGVLYTPDAYDLKTGKPIAPLAGGGQFSAGMQLLCSTFAACPAIAMARQSSLGFRDLAGQSGTYQYPIVRSSCWINMIPAGGLVVVPEGGSSCMCAYNYKTSLALMSDDRQFHYGLGGSGLPGVSGLRVNFGAPGDRPDAAGQMWHGYPRPVAYGRCLGDQPYGPKEAGPKLPIDEPAAGGACRPWGRNPDWIGITGTDQPSLYSCGLEGPLHLAFRLPEDAEKSGRLRVVLYFCELDEPPTARVFDVKLQGNTVEHGLDVAKQAGGPRKALAREYVLDAAKTVTLELVPQNPSAPPPTISGISILAE
jgi:outer membrane protein assembly factor BamB